MSNEWISVDTELPDQHEDVLLVHVSEFFNETPFVGFLTRKNTWASNKEHVDCDTGTYGNGGVVIDIFEPPTHWQRLDDLPSPPEGEK